MAKKSELLEKLQETEERFRQITEHIRDVFYLTDDKLTNILYVSPAYEAIWQQSIKNLYEHPGSWRDSIHPDDGPHVNKEVEKMKETGYMNIKYRIVRPDGTIRWLHDRAFPVYDNANRLYRIAGVVEDITEAVLMEEERLEQIKQIKDSIYQLVLTITNTFAQRDPFTVGHQKNVALIAGQIARRLNLPEDTIEGIELIASVHDIGKIGIPGEILNKPGKLTPVEFELIKTHSEAGYEILKNIHAPWPIAEMVLEHHERLDGSGYPRGLKGDEIRFETRILSAADAIEAMLAYKPYRKGLGIEKTIKELKKERNILFDPDVVDAGISVLRDKKFLCELKRRGISI